VRRSLCCAGRRLFTATATAVVAIVIAAGSASAEVSDPAAQEPPGASKLDMLLGWLKWGVGKAAYGAFIIGAIAAAVGHIGEHSGAAMKARKYIMGACGAVLLASGAAAMLNALGA
jgi:hypothetical protein